MLSLYSVKSPPLEVLYEYKKKLDSYNNQQNSTPNDSSDSNIFTQTITSLSKPRLPSSQQKLSRESPSGLFLGVLESMVAVLEFILLRSVMSQLIREAHNPYLNIVLQCIGLILVLSALFFHWSRTLRMNWDILFEHIGFVSRKTIDLLNIQNRKLSHVATFQVPSWKKTVFLFLIFLFLDFLITFSLQFILHFQFFSVSNLLVESVSSNQLFQSKIAQLIPTTPPFSVMIGALSQDIGQFIGAYVEKGLINFPRLFRLIIITPILEEILFRGLLLAILNHRFAHPFVNITLSNILFSLLHTLNFGNFNFGYVVFQILFAFLIGFCFSLANLYTSSLWTSIFCHIFNNFFSIWVSTQSGVTMDSMFMYPLMQACICYCIIAFILFNRVFTLYLFSHTKLNLIVAPTPKKTN